MERVAAFQLLPSVGSGQKKIQVAIHHRSLSVLQQSCAGSPFWCRRSPRASLKAEVIRQQRSEQSLKLRTRIRTNSFPNGSLLSNFLQDTIGRKSGQLNATNGSNDIDDEFGDVESDEPLEYEDDDEDEYDEVVEEIAAVEFEDLGDAIDIEIMQPEPQIVAAAPDIVQVDMPQRWLDDEDPMVERELGWWEVMYPKAAGLSREEFEKWRPFLDCYVFDPEGVGEGWTMQEIKEHGWDAIKFWRQNAYPADFGEIKNDEAEFAAESMVRAAEEKVEEPSVDVDWLDRLTEKGQAERTRMDKNRPRYLTVLENSMQELENTGFPERKSLDHLRRLDVEKTNRLEALVVEGRFLENSAEEGEDNAGYVLEGEDLLVLRKFNEDELKVLEEIDVRGEAEMLLMTQLEPILRSQQMFLDRGFLREESLEGLLRLTSEAASLVQRYSQAAGHQGWEAAGADTMIPSEKPPEVFLRPPRDWPPPGWQVDVDELAFIHGGDDCAEVGAQADLSGEQPASEEEFVQKNFPRYYAFLGQYAEWVHANKDRLDEEAAVADPAYHPGRRRLGEEYQHGMYELPFLQEGQYFYGEVEACHAYEGIFVNIGAVHDAWVSVKYPDWIHVRNAVRPGQRVLVEVLAKRDPWRYRFPLEARLVDPNLDNLITIKREFPPIFGRLGDTNVAEVAREVDRPLPQISRQDIDQRVPSFWLQDRPFPDHPFLPVARERHRVEQELLDIEERRGEIPSWAWDRYASVVDLEKLDLEGARAEREAVRALLAEVGEVEEGEEEARAVQRPPSRMEQEFAHLQAEHRERHLEQRRAVQRDIAARVALGLPLEEWGRFGNDQEVGVDPVDRLCSDSEKSSGVHVGMPEAAHLVWNNWACDSSVAAIPEASNITLNVNMDKHWSAPQPFTSEP